MNKKSTLCQICRRKIDHKIKYQGRAICKECLGWVNSKKFDKSFNYKSGDLVQTADGIMEIQ